MTTGEKLSWEEIEEQYDQEWVQLIDHEWDHTNPYPSAGVVRVHAKTRKEFDRLTLQDPPRRFACLFVGIRPKPKNVIVQRHRFISAVVDNRQHSC